jgi:hypothetical protein
LSGPRRSYSFVYSCKGLQIFQHSLARRTIERIARLGYDSASTEVEGVAPPQIEMIRTRCGFYGGVEDFVIPVLTEDDPVESIAKAQRRSAEAMGLSVITDPEGRVGIRGGSANLAEFENVKSSANQ